MKVTRIYVAILLTCQLSGVVRAQVASADLIKDPSLRALQAKHLSELTAASAEIAAHAYPAKFYLTGELDLSGRALESPGQRSIEFAMFEKQTVLLVKGNYAVIYPWATPPEDRVSRTYLDVAVPILNALAPRLKNETAMDAIVVELSHHVRKDVLVRIDRFENSAFIFPRAVAQKIVEASDPAQQLAALKEVKVYIDGRVVAFKGQLKAPAAISETQNRPGSAPASAAPAPPKEDLPAAALEKRQSESQPVLDRMVQELGAEAHFDPAARPAVISFRGVSYLRLSLITSLTPADAGSQYRLAALAFDRHVSHLIRSVLPYYKGSAGFEGVSFRTTVQAGSNSAPEVVDFLFTLADLRRYESYDITGQQLINSGFVLINGERVSLDLQTAETVKP